MEINTCNPRVSEEEGKGFGVMEFMVIRRRVSGDGRGSRWWIE
jgi:hypothetical protein